jgi:hypothetical protein
MIMREKILPNILLTIGVITSFIILLFSVILFIDFIKEKNEIARKLPEKKVEKPQVWHTVFDLYPNINMAIPFKPEFQHNEINDNKLINQVFKKADYYFAQDKKLDLTILVYSYEFKNKKAEYSLKIGLNGIANKLAENLNMKIINDSFYSVKSQKKKNNYLNLKADIISSNNKYHLIILGCHYNEYLGYVSIIAPVENKAIMYQIIKNTSFNTIHFIDLSTQIK